jgi:hypothetical protein
MSKFFKYQQVDSKTGISAAIEPAKNGLKHPDLPELKVITFSKDGVWVYAEVANTAVENPDNYIFEIDKSQFAFEIKTKIDLIKEERIAELGRTTEKFIEDESNQPQDPLFQYRYDLAVKTYNELQDIILDRLNSFVFDDNDPIESHNQWDNKFEILSLPTQELKIPYYSVSFKSRLDFYVQEVEERVKENGTDEEKIAIGLIPPPSITEN